MRLAISNIAWTPQEKDTVYALLTARGVKGLEAAPGLLFPGAEHPLAPPTAMIDRVIQELDHSGLQLVAMQALHFGLAKAQLFGDTEGHREFCGAIEQAAILAGELGAKALVIGSPKQRLRGTMTLAEAEAVAINAFRELGDHAAKYGVSLALEPNPTIYGADFMTHLADAVSLAERIDHPAVGVNLDLGERCANEALESLKHDIETARPSIKHVHASLPQLPPLSDDPEPAKTLLRALKALPYDGWVSIEMRRHADDPLGAISASLDLLNQELQAHA